MYILSNKKMIQRVGKKSPYTHTICTQNQFKFTQHSHTTMYNGSLATALKIVHTGADSLVSPASRWHTHTTGQVIKK
jgi:hypothetical protein